MNLSRRAKYFIKRAVLGAGTLVTVLCVALAGIGFLIAGFYVWLSGKTGFAPAAAITGGVMLALALALGLTGGAILKRMRQSLPSLASELGGTIGLGARLAAMLVRRDPKKALIISIIAGALAEYILSDKKKE